ncbi:MAG: AzlD domain-containing protein [Pseudobdellovibrionaceae bacterium]
MNSTTPTVLAIILLGMITLFYRFSFINKHGAKFADKIPTQLLKFLGPATFSAIVANNLIATNSTPQIFKIKIAVAALSLIVAYVSKSILITLVFGLGLLSALQFLL